MAERLFRLSSLLFLGVGLAVGLGSVEHRPSVEPIESASHRNPTLEIEAAQEIQAINRGELSSFESQSKRRPTKEMAASFSQQ